jgi:opacity protein-like surface antigen
MRTFTPLLLACAALTSAFAQSPFAVGLNVARGLDGITKVTDKAWGGGSLEVGYQGILGGTKIPFRAALAYGQFPGAKTMTIRHFTSMDPFTSHTEQVSGVDTTLKNLQLSGDIFLPTPVSRLSFVSGISINKWHADNPWITLGRDPNPDAPSQAKRSTGPELKFGFRAGLSYELNERMTCVLRYQFSALGSTFGLDDSDPAKPGILQVDRPVNPTWLDLGITYRF